MNTVLELTRLEELAKAATPGPWATVGQPWLPPDCETYVVAGNGDPHVSEIVCDFLDAALAGAEDKYQDHEWGARNDANAAYIAACSPEITLALIRAAKALSQTRAELYWCADQLKPRGHPDDSVSRALIEAAEALNALRASQDLQEDGK